MTAFDPEAYWTAHGPFLAPAGSSSPDQALVEKELAFILNDLPLKIRSVIDVGCGQGRLAQFLTEALPDASYAGMDLAQAQLDGTAKVRPDGDFYLSKLQDFRPDKKWDLAICSEVLMHIPPPDMYTACKNLKALARKFVVTIDWTKDLGRDVQVAEWNWLHAYEEYLGSPDLQVPVVNQSIFLWMV